MNVVRHLSVVPCVAVCGADVPNQRTTNHLPWVTCSCCRAWAYRLREQDVAAIARVRQALRVT